ncbi:hypothetical protein F4553_005670 [Allocatelliglobosispora scoriae]|uniref:Uncharacterized protein n=1 Tax=Allocatelliglobosispora scoriae TaxID=643052 RepID=A0A841BXI5_9ACTN|nr:hypothetical protein [Allocatelliglobosispora scoriae]MBB5872236.1 hypothetical protein [Allocatelliglobosispora scoriae]
MTADRGYPDERWYAEDRGTRDGYAEPDWSERRNPYGVPEQRHTDDPRRGLDPRGSEQRPEARYASLAELSSEAERRRAERPPADPRPADPRPVDPRPALEARPPADQPPPEPPTEPVDRASLRRAAEGPTRLTAEPAPDGVYRSKRPGVAVGIGLALGVLELAMARVFAAGVFGDPLDVSRAVAGGLMLVALPLLGIGLYALATGAARAVDLRGPRVWLRPPLAYLVVALVLIVAAGAAA